MRHFTVTVPPEWVRIDPQDAASGVRAAAQRLLRDRSADQRVRALPLLVEQLGRVASEMEQKGVSAVLLGVDALDPRVGNPMVVIRPLDLPEGVEPLDYLVGLAASDSTAEIMEVDHVVGLRTHATEPVDPGRSSPSVPMQGLIADEDARERVETALSSSRLVRRIRYVLGHPNAPDSWADLYASVQVPNDAQGRELADAYSALFDELAKGFRWED